MDSNDKAQELIDRFKELMAEQAKANESKSSCPNCGYCPHCGRSASPIYPTYPTYPWYPGYPYAPYWWQTHTVTVAQDTALGNLNTSGFITTSQSNP